MHTQLCGGKRSLGRTKRRWVTNINMDKKIGCKGVNWIQLTPDSHIGGLHEHSNKPSYSIQGNHT
jgi:hypothetical protein